MKKKNIYLKIIMVALFTFAIMPSCTDLDEEVFSQVTADNFFQSEEELISALGAAYTSLYGYMGAGNFWGANEVTSDELTVPTRGSGWGDGGHWVRGHTHTWNPNDPMINDPWNFLFGGVNSCNRLIFQFEELQNPLTDPFIAELKALRAVYYLWLLDMYGNVPIVTSFADADPTPVNNSRAEVFAFVESELLGSLNDVSDKVDGTTYGRVNQMVVQTALGRLYLNAEVYTGTEQWGKANDALDEVILSEHFSLEGNYFANFNTDNGGSSETIFAIPYNSVFAAGMNIVMMTLPGPLQATYSLPVTPWNGHCAIEDFYNTYEDTDLRKGEPGTEAGPSTVRGNFIVGAQWDESGTVRIEDAGFEPGDADGAPMTMRPGINELEPNALREHGARIGKWEIESGSQQEMNNDVAIFRYADVLLMKAEALWRQDAGDAEALDLVNQIRARAGVDPFTQLTADNLLAERGREMWVEAVRRSDQIRFGTWGDAWWEKPISDETKELFPIPGSQIDANPNLTQNPGY